MKRYKLFFMALMTLATTGAVKAQVEDVADPLLQYKNKETGLKFTAGGRLISDVAYYHSDYTPMNSGAAITDARIRASLTYKDFYFYADFDFSKGGVKQKNIFVRYNFAESLKGIHSLKAGYFCEPSTMSYNTSQYNYHFISRPAAVNALAPGRSLGVAYKYYSQHFFADQGIFAENKYNDQIAGFQGFTGSGRWLYKPINNEDMTIHVGVSARYARMNGGEVVNNVFTTHQNIQAAMETAVDPTSQFLNADLPWARSNLNLGAEALIRTNRVFARGEYIYKKVYKERPDNALFINQLGDWQSWTTLESWKKGNPQRTSNFSGAYAEFGFLLRGDGYKYDDEYGILAGTNDKGALEIVARYSYTNLNDINDGDFFLIGKKRFYPGGVVSDYPVKSTSVGGGKMHAATIGLNYTFNQYLKLMGQYQYCSLDNVYFPMDKNFHQLQMRLLISF